MSGTHPQDLGLVTLRLPVGAYASILHRITGILLTGAVVLGVVLLRDSLQGAGAFRQVAGRIGGPWGHVIGPLAVWAAAQHLFGGMRHLAHDAGWGFGRDRSRAAALTVIVLALFAGLGALWAWP
ncbi:succinate dehydrogenase, cytochrome b556 subunit [Acidiferrobacter sp.]|uniref:succinate dehydrogenase, cytochrome b556 subunit n=1 Tax=Acidiferrobacter sp. TaxID=1872107 RepID=UPI00261A9013|nr:succinate dehydrogenase, cytochrome b556 subunit [Acidiferrobacter sp.]